MPSGRTRDPGAWNFASRRAGGQGLTVYLDGPTLRKAFGDMPPAIEYKVYACENTGKIILKMREAQRDQ